MLLQKGKVGGLKGDWLAIELTSEARIEECVLHVTRWLAEHSDCFQLFFPVESRDLDGVKMLTPYLLARSVSSVDGVKGCKGVQGVVVDGNGRPVPIADAFVREVMEKARECAEGWSRGVKQWSFVRVLLGSQRMLCGKVQKVVNGQADVLISLRVRNVRLRIPVTALLNLGAVPKGEQEYYYRGGL